MRSQHNWFNTDGYNDVKIFDPTGGRQCSRAYSRQYKSRWIAVAVFAVVLLIASLLPSPLRRHPEFSRFGPDKLLHLVGHAGFAAVLIDALAAGRLDDREAAVLSVGISTGYGIVTGKLQEWIPGRAPERADFVAGVLGSIIGLLGWRYGIQDP